MLRVSLLLTMLLWIAPAAAAGRSVHERPKSGRSTGELKLPETSGTNPESAQTSAPPQRGPTRLDFDDRLVQGQTNKSGAVYLYDRKELKVRSMVGKRESFREEILKTVYDE